MSNQIVVPSLGESITEATVSKWLKQVGEHVNADEPLVELETDKVNVEVPSPLDGTLSSISVKEGDSVEVGAILGIVADGKSKTTVVKKTKTIDQDEKLNNQQPIIVETANFGGVNTYSTSTDGYQITAVGEVPKTTVQLIVNSVKSSP